MHCKRLLWNGPQDPPVRHQHLVGTEVEKCLNLLLILQSVSIRFSLSKVLEFEENILKSR